MQSTISSGTAFPRSIPAMLRRRQAAIFPFLDVALNVLNYGFHIYTARLLAPDQYGRMNALLAILAMLMILGISLQMHTARESSASDAKPSLSRFVLYLCPSIILMSLMFLRPLSQWQGSSPGELLLLLLVFPLHLLLSHFRGYMQGQQKFFRLSTSYFIETAVKLILIVVLVSLRATAAMALIAVSVGYIAALAHAFASEKGGLTVSKSTGFGPILLANAALYLFTSLDMVLVNARLPQDVPSYAVIQKFGMLLFYAGSSLMTVLLPRLSSAATSSQNGAERFRRSLIFVLVTAAAALWSFHHWVPLLIVPVFGRDYINTVALMPKGGTVYVLLYVVQFATTSLMAKGNRFFPWINIAAVIGTTLWTLIIAESLADVMHFQIALYGGLALILLYICRKEFTR